MGIRVFRVAAAVACLAAVVPCASAQQATTGTLIGFVHDQHGSAVTGAEISVTGPAGAHVARSDVTGAFTFRFLPPGTYVVEVAREGFATLRVGDVVVAAGIQTRQPLGLLPGKEEEVTLEVSAPLVDPKKVEMTSVFKTNQVIAGKPTGSDFTDVVTFAPGVVSGLGTGDGNWSIGGSSGFENSYVVDGVNVTDSRYGAVGLFVPWGGGAHGPGVTTDMLDEVQVKSAGFDAEYGQALGGVVTAVIKTGTNRFSGSLRGSASEFSGGEPVSLVTAAGNTDWSESRDASLAVTAGGPLVKDRLFAFAAFNPARSTRQQETERVTNPILELDPGAAKTYLDQYPYPASLTGGVDRTWTSYNYAAKLTWNAAASHRLDLVAFGNPASGPLGLGMRHGDLALWGRADTDGDGVADADVVKNPASFEDGGGWSDIEFGAEQVSLRYDGLLHSDWFLEGQVSFRRSTYEETSRVDDFSYRDDRTLNEWYYGGDMPYGLRIAAGGAGFTGPTTDTTWDVAFKASRILGDHDLKFGGEYFSLEYDWRSEYSGPERDYAFPRADGTTFLVRSHSGGLVDVAGGIPGCDACVVAQGAPQYRVKGVRLNPDQPPLSGSEWSLFIQDTWSIDDRWVVKLGLRSTKEEFQGSDDFTLAFATDPENPGYFTDTPTRYSSAGYSFPIELSPRLGVSFDPAGDGRTKLYASAARYYQRVPANVAVGLSNSVWIAQMRFSDADLTTPAPGRIWAGGGNYPEGIVVDGTRLPYMDEATLGWQQLLRPDLALEVRGIYRTLGRVLEDVNLASVESVQNYYYWIDADGDGTRADDPSEIPFPGQSAHPLEGNVLANPGGNTGERFGQPERDYQALELLLSKRLSNDWQLTANYRYSRLRGNYEGLYRNDNGVLSPTLAASANLNTVFDFPDSPLMRSQYESGILNTDRPHVFNAFGSYFFGNGVELAGAFQWASGVPRTPLLAHPLYQNGGELPGTGARYMHYDLDAGRWTLAGPGEPGWFLGDYTAASRGDLGRTPDLISLDLHAGWAIPIRDTRLKIGLDVANVFNHQAVNGNYDYVELTSGVGNPDYGKPIAYQMPRTTTLTLEWAW